MTTTRKIGWLAVMSNGLILAGAIGGLMWLLIAALVCGAGFMLDRQELVAAQRVSAFDPFEGPRVTEIVEETCPYKQDAKGRWRKRGRFVAYSEVEEWQARVRVQLARRG